MTRTTIQIDESTHVRLIKKRGITEAKTGQDTTFDDVINELLDQDNKRHR